MRELFSHLLFIEGFSCVIIISFYRRFKIVYYIYPTSLPFLILYLFSFFPCCFPSSFMCWYSSPNVLAFYAVLMHFSYHWIATAIYSNRCSKSVMATRYPLMLGNSIMHHFILLWSVNYDYKLVIWKTFLLYHVPYL